MRLTEILSFLNKNPKGEDILKFSHIYVPSIKKEMKKNRELRNFIKNCRKENKEKIKIWEEDILAEKIMEI